MKCETHQPYKPKVILAVGAHPDDIDFGASGSLAKWAKAGARVEYLVITDGSKGSPDLSMTSKQLIKLRQGEQNAAARTLGAGKVHFLGYPDGYLEVTIPLKKDIVRVIRQVRPDTVVVMDPSVLYDVERGFINHPDHRAAGQATLDAVFPLARDHLTFPDLLHEEGLEPHKVAHMLLINFERQNCWIDITGTFDLKLAALNKHASQVPDANELRALLKEWATAAGQQAGFELAEGFLRIDPPV